MEPITLAVLAFFGAAVLLFANVQGLVLERHESYKTIRRLRAIDMAPNDIRKRELSRPFMRRVVAPGLLWFGKLGKRITPANVIERLTVELRYAGSPESWDAERVLAFKVLVAVAGAATAIVMGLGIGPTRGLVLAGVLGVVGYYLPEWVVRSRAGKRQHLIRRALPDALDLLSITVEAGLGFDAAVARVARQAGGPLGEELHRMLQEMQLGKPRAEALRDLGDRSNLQELKSFVLAMVQADVFGISIAKVLHVQAQELRLRRRQLAEEKAQKIPVKITFPLIVNIFPALFVVVLGPAVITIYHTIINR